MENLTYLDSDSAKLLELVPELVEALRGMLDNHVRLVSSGDCGNWDVEAEKETIAARAVLAKL